MAVRILLATSWDLSESKGVFQAVAVKSKRLPHFKVSRELAHRIDRKRGKKLESAVVVVLEACAAP